MKTLLAFIIIFNFSFCYSQYNNSQYKPSEIFNSIFKNIEIKEGIKYETLKYKKIYGPVNPINERVRLYSSHEKYKLDNGQIVSLDIYPDSTVLFNEYKIAHSGADSSISSGELKIMKDEYELQEFNFVDSRGGDSIFIDTLFHLVPHGFWIKNIDSSHCEIGDYNKGEKNGTWYILNSEYKSSSIAALMKELIYKNGELKSERTIDISKMNIETEDVLGEWFSVRLNRKDIMNCYEYKCSLFFVRDKSKYAPNSIGTFDYLNLQENNNFDLITTYRCGTGLKPDTVNHKWLLDEQGYLILDDYKWKIEYLTDEKMIISIELETEKK